MLKADNEPIRKRGLFLHQIATTTAAAVAIAIGFFGSNLQAAVVGSFHTIDGTRNNLDLNRSIYDKPTGTDSDNPRQPINPIRTFIDASNLYGAAPMRAAALRTLEGGKLKTTYKNTKLSDIIRRNTEIQNIQDNVFLIASIQDVAEPSSAIALLGIGATMLMRRKQVKNVSSSHG